MDAFRVRAEYGKERKLDAERVIERQEGLEQILLSPGSTISNNPLARVLVRQEHIVDMNPYAGGQPWQQIEDDPVDVAAGFHGVRRVDEENVVRTEHRKRSPPCRDPPRVADGRLRP